MKKAVIFLANGYEEVEAMAPVDLLRRAGVEVKILSVDGSSFVEGAHGIGIKADGPLDEAACQDADLVLLPGGMPGTRNLDASETVRAVVGKACEEGRYVGAICAAPSVLGHMGILKGRRATCYPGFEEELLGAEVCAEPVVVDGNVITARGVGAALDFGLKLVELLVDGETATTLRKGIVYER